jgi:hypothetical protein
VQQRRHLPELSGATDRIARRVVHAGGAGSPEVLSVDAADGEVGVVTTVEIVRELPVSESGASQVLVKIAGAYYVVSSVDAMFTGFETLVFLADETGEVTDWVDIAGGRGMSRDEAIRDLERMLTEKDAESE